MKTEFYGELESEKLAKDKSIAREIVKEISNFGISDRQRWLIIYFLSLELENHLEMQELVDVIKDLKSDIFLAKES